MTLDIETLTYEMLVRKMVWTANELNMNDDQNRRTKIANDGGGD